MKRYIIFLLFFINFIPIYTDGNWFFDIGFRAFAYYDESENWDYEDNDPYTDPYGDGDFYDFGNFCGWDLDGDGDIDSISYIDPETNDVVVEGLHNGNDDWNNDDYNNNSPEENSEDDSPWYHDPNNDSEGGYPEDYYPGGSGDEYVPGNTPDEPTNPQPPIAIEKKFMDNLYGDDSNLTEYQQNKLKDCVKKMSENPYTKMMLQKLIDSGDKLKFIYDPTKQDQALFNKNTITFNSDAGMSPEQITEELIHAMQYNLVYNHNMPNVLNNDEYEAKTFEYLLCRSYDLDLGLDIQFTCQPKIALEFSNEQCLDYDKLIVEIIHTKSLTPELEAKYHEFGDYWKTPFYNKPYDKNKKPELINYFFKHLYNHE